MPSNAYTEYKKNLDDVHRLILLHRNLSGTDRGKRGLGHLTRGGLLLLCAAWERYIETVLIEGADFLCANLASFNDLPTCPRTTVKNYVNRNNNSWANAQLSTNDWKNIYVAAIKEKIEKLNTPKYEKIQPIFNHYLDLPDIGACWTKGATIIDDFVSLRGDVAHRGRQSKYVRFGNLTKHESLIMQYVKETDNSLADHLYSLVTPNRRPWNRSA